MMNKIIYNKIVQNKAEKKKSFAVLIDPDKVDLNSLENLIDTSIKASVDYFFVGGSLIVNNHLDNCIKLLKQQSNIPVVLFPGSPHQLSKHADALLYLSLISGRNPELLIGQHVISAPFVRESGLEIIPTGYMVIDGGKPTAVSYMSNSAPIPANKNEIALCTALAGEMLGLKLIYMDAGSGALNPVNESMIKTVSQNINIPLIIGGGINTPERAYLSCKSGADIVVIGNAIEKSTSLIFELADAIHSNNKVI